MEIRLTIYDDEKRHFSQSIKLPCVVGRGRHCDVVVVHPLISRKHCEFYFEGRRLMARDLGSLNGVFYRGKRLERPVELAFGEEISLAGLNFLVESLEATATHAYNDLESVPEDSVVDLEKFDLGGSSF
ncbi:MAG: FHA domain-containing protein [Thermoguttaceae bacterium]|nr:FHA domain-containing protein [Thermoguttaceae bacterium]